VEKNKHHSRKMVNGMRRLVQATLPGNSEEGLQKSFGQEEKREDRRRKEKGERSREQYTQYVKGGKCARVASSGLTKPNDKNPPSEKLGGEEW